MRNKEILETTTNRKTYNRAYKKHLYKKGKINCTYCPYNRGENRGGNWYAGVWKSKSKKYDIKHPSWKLATKNRKQWMKKNVRFEEVIQIYGHRYIKVIW